MAILIQEEGKKGMLIPFAVGGIILVAAAALTYYLFFSPAPFVDTVGSDEYESVSVFARANLDIESVTDSPVWSALERESPVQPLSPQVFSRRDNPFGFSEQ